MVIEQKLIGTKGIFYAEDEGEVAGELFFHMTAPDHMVIEHTEVEEQFRGQNIGYQLVHAAVEHARQHKIRITVYCPFAKKVFDKKPDWNDVLAT